MAKFCVVKPGKGTANLRKYNSIKKILKESGALNNYTEKAQEDLVLGYIGAYEEIHNTPDIPSSEEFRGWLNSQDFREKIKITTFETPKKRAQELSKASSLITFFVNEDSERSRNTGTIVDLHNDQSTMNWNDIHNGMGLIEARASKIASHLSTMKEKSVYITGDTILKGLKNSKINKKDIYEYIFKLLNSLKAKVPGLIVYYGGSSVFDDASLIAAQALNLDVKAVINIKDSKKNQFLTDVESLKLRNKILKEVTAKSNNSYTRRLSTPLNLSNTLIAVGSTLEGNRTVGVRNLAIEANLDVVDEYTPIDDQTFGPDNVITIAMSSPLQSQVQSTNLYNNTNNIVEKALDSGAIVLTSTIEAVEKDEEAVGEQKLIQFLQMKDKYYYQEIEKNGIKLGAWQIKPEIVYEGIKERHDELVQWLQEPDAEEQIQDVVKTLQDGMSAEEALKKIVPFFTESEQAEIKEVMKADEEVPEGERPLNTRIVLGREGKNQGQIYANRTAQVIEKSDIVLAIAEDFTTAEEKLTKNIAGNKYINIQYNKANLQEDIQNTIKSIKDKVQDEKIVLNIAGNGIYSLKEDQESVNEYIKQIVEGLIDNDIKISEIITGGQSGVDEAGTQAAIALGIPNTVIAPNNWAVRDKENKSTTNKEAFIKRFNGAVEDLLNDLAFKSPKQKVLNIASAFRSNDAAFFEKTLIDFFKRNNQIPFSDPKRVVAVEIWSKHDGLPIKNILEACKKYRIAPIVSFSITGLGNTAYEPGVLKPDDLLDLIEGLIKRGIVDPKTTTIRIDPIIPGVTTKESFKEIMLRAGKMGIHNFITSVLQSYGYADGIEGKDRHVTSGINAAYQEEHHVDYPWEEYYGFTSDGKINHFANQSVKEEWGAILIDLMKEVNEELGTDNAVEIKSCAFPFENGIKKASCLDPDIVNAITGINVFTKNEESGEKTFPKSLQRKDCMCYRTSGDIPAMKKTCASRCAYCYMGHSVDRSLRYYTDKQELVDSPLTRLEDDPYAIETEDRLWNTLNQGDERTSSKESYEKELTEEMQYTWSTNTIDERAFRIYKIFDTIVTYLTNRLPINEHMTTEREDRIYVITKKYGISTILDMVKKQISKDYVNRQAIVNKLQDHYNEEDWDTPEFQVEIDKFIQEGKRMLKFFPLLTTKANFYITNMEGVSILNENGILENPTMLSEEDEEKLTIHQEGYFFKPDEFSTLDLVDTDLNHLLNNLYEEDNEGYRVRFDSLFDPIPIPIKVVHLKLTDIISTTTNSSQMIRALGKEVSKFPWLSQVITILRGLDTDMTHIYEGMTEEERRVKAVDIQAKFFTSYRTATIDIIQQQLDSNGEVYSNMLSQATGEDAAYKDVQNNCRNSIPLYYDSNKLDEGTNDHKMYPMIYNPYATGSFNKENFKYIEDLLENDQSLFWRLKNKGVHGIKYTEEDIEVIIIALKSAGFSTSSTVLRDFFTNIPEGSTEARIEEIKTNRFILAKGVCEFYRSSHKSYFLMTQFDDTSKEGESNNMEFQALTVFDAFWSNYKPLIKVIGTFETTYDDYSVFVDLNKGRKRVYSRITPNQISTTISKLANMDQVSEQEYQQRMEQEYLKNWWYRYGPQNGHNTIYSGWLEDAMNPEYRGMFKLTTVKASFGIAYEDELAAQGEMTRLNEFFFSPKDSASVNWAIDLTNYSVPTLSDTKVNYFIRNRKYSLSSKTDASLLWNRMSNLLLQEINRMKVIQKREALRKAGVHIEEIAVWEKQGMKFNFFPSLNKEEIKNALFQELEAVETDTDAYREILLKYTKMAIDTEWNAYVQNINTWHLGLFSQNIKNKNGYALNPKTPERSAMVRIIKSLLNTSVSNAYTEAGQAQTEKNTRMLKRILDYMENKYFTAEMFESMKNQLQLVINSYDATISTKMTGQLNNISGLSKDSQEVMDRLYQYFVNSFYAQSQIVEILMVDPAFLKGPDKFQKRFKQVYSPIATGLTYYEFINDKGELEQHDGSKEDDLTKKTEYSITLKDFDLVAPSIEELTALLDARTALNTKDHIVLSDRQRQDILDSMTKIVSTDAQCYRSLSSWEKCLTMLGNMGNPNTRKAIQRLKNGTWSSEDYWNIFEVIKPFVSSFNWDVSHVNDSLPENERDPQYDSIKVPVQHKNSEFVLLAMYEVLSGVLKSSPMLIGLNKFMEDHGIDKVQFETAVKEGSQGVVDLAGIPDKTDTKSVQEYLEQVTGLTVGKQAYEGNPEVVHSTPFDDYGRSANLKEHMLTVGKSSGGTQLLQCIMEDLPDATPVKFGGHLFNKKQIVTIYQRIFTINLIESFGKVNETLTNPKKLSAYLKRVISSDPRYDNDLLNYLEVGEDGDFVRPLIDPLLKRQFDSLCASLIRKQEQKQPFRIAAVPQVSSFGLEENLAIRYQNKAGELILNEGEFNKKLTANKVVTATDSNGNIKSFKNYQSYKAFNNSKDQIGSIAYMEVYLPVYDKEMIEPFIYKKDVYDAKGKRIHRSGEVDLESLKAHADPKIFEALAYRVPVESKHSYIPIKIKGFLPSQNSSCVIAAPEWIAMSDSDHDGDKLFIILPETEITRDLKEIVNIIWSKFKETVKDKVPGEQLKSKEFQRQILFTVNEYLKDKKDKNTTKIEDIKKKGREGFGNEYDQAIYNIGEEVMDSNEFIYISPVIFNVEKAVDNTPEALCNAWLNSIKSNSKAARNNCILDLMISLLRTAENSQLMLTPGGFPEAKRVSKIIKALKNKANIKQYNRDHNFIHNLLNMTADQAELYNVDEETLSLCNPVTRTNQQVRNMVGADLIPIYAVSRTFKVLLEASNAMVNKKIAININGNKSLIQREEGYSLGDIQNRVGQYITDNICQLMGCAVDNAKDPLLDTLGQDKTIINISLLLVNMGYTLEEVALFMNQPVIKQIIEDIKGNERGNYLNNTVAQYYKFYQQTYGMSADELQTNPGVAQLSSEELGFALLESSRGEELSLHTQQIQAIVVQNLYNLLTVSSLFSKLNQATRSMTSSGGISADSSYNMEKQLLSERIKAIVRADDPLLLNAEYLLPLVDDFMELESINEHPVPMNAAFTHFIVDKIPNQFKRITDTYTPFIQNVIREFSSIFSKPLKSNEITALSNAAMSYFMSSCRAFSNNEDIRDLTSDKTYNYRRSILLGLPPTIMRIKRDMFNNKEGVAVLKNNFFIQNLIVKLNNPYNNYFDTLSVTSNVKGKSGIVEQFKRSWEELFNMGDTMISVQMGVNKNNDPIIIKFTTQTLAEMLFAYCFYTHGLTPGGESFIQCFPIIKTDQIRDYNSNLKLLQNTEGGFADLITDVIDQFIANNSTNKNFVYSLTGTEIDILTDHISEESKTGWMPNVLSFTLPSPTLLQSDPQLKKLYEAFLKFKIVKEQIIVERFKPYVKIQGVDLQDHLYKGSFDRNTNTYNYIEMTILGTNQKMEYEIGKTAIKQQPNSIKTVFKHSIQNNEKRLYNTETEEFFKEAYQQVFDQEFVESDNTQLTVDDSQKIVKYLEEKYDIKVSLNLNTYNNKEKNTDLTGVQLCAFIK